MWSPFLTLHRWADPETGASPLYAACEHNRFDCAKLLLDRHYSASKARSDGLPPLYGAMQHGSLPFVVMLLDAGADPAVQVQGVSLVECAVSLGPKFEKIANELRKRLSSDSALGEQTAPSSSSAGESAKSVAAVAPPQRKRTAPGSLAMISEAPEEEEEEEEEGEDEGEEEEDEERAEEDKGVENEVIFWLTQLEMPEVVQRPEKLDAVIRELEQRWKQAGALLQAFCLEERLTKARNDLKRLRLSRLDPLYDLAHELPDDLPHDGKPSFTAHTIMIVDCSGSMRKEDVKTSVAGESPISRIEAVRRAILHTYLKPQLVAGAQQSERFSLIKIQPEAAERPLPFALFPLDVSLAPRIDAVLDEPRGAGPYLPALGRMNKLIEHSQRHLFGRARTQVLFLSDGRPSDHVNERELPSLIQAELRQTLEGLVAAGNLEQFQLLGFGEADESTLKMMADAVPGNIATHQIISGESGYSLLESSVATFSSNSSVSRIASVSAAHESSKPLRRVHYTFTERMDVYKDCEIALPPKKLGDFNGDLQPLRGTHDVVIARRILGHGGASHKIRTLISLSP